MNDLKNKRLQHQLYLARENPEPSYDVSKCDLTMVPQGCFSLCKVLRKKKLYLNNNQIKSLNSNGNNVEDLIVLTHLHLEFNEITKLPDNINSIQYLQVLNISNNKLEFITPSIGDLLYLRELLVQNNQIDCLPETIFTTNSSLEIINVSENKKFSLIPLLITNLPKLRKFDCTTTYLKYPPQNICEQGFVEIMKKLCKANGIQLNESFIERVSNYEDINIDVVDSSILDYENFKHNRLDFLKSLDKEYDQIISFQKSFSNRALHDRMEFINKLAEEETKITNEISRMQRDRDRHRQQLINDVIAAENDAANLIEEIMTISKKCQNQEKMLDEIENETMKKYLLYQVSKDEFEQLRRNEILNAMSQMLISQEITNRILKGRLSNQENLKQTISMTHSISDKALSEIINEKRLKQNEIIGKIENEENEQKLAFQQLQLQKDIRTLRLSEHIYSVESELILLSQAEKKKRAEKVDFKFNILNERRQQLIEMLDNLIHQKELRERVLYQRIMEMEKQRQKDQEDFWLIQYQRCLDMKPHCFWDENHGLDCLVMELLNRVNATEYLPFFLRHKVSWEQVEGFEEKNFIELGIHNKTLIKNILNVVKEIKLEQEKKLEAKLTWKTSKNDEKVIDKSTTKSIPSVITSHRETECCICLNEETTILFMTCGHICCCEKCSNNLNECPLCRSEIIRIVKLSCW